MLLQFFRVWETISWLLPANLLYMFLKTGQMGKWNGQWKSLFTFDRHVLQFDLSLVSHLLFSTALTLLNLTSSSLCPWRLAFKKKAQVKSAVQTTAKSLSEDAECISQQTLASKWARSSGCRKHGGKCTIVHLHIQPTLFWYKSGWKISKLTIWVQL